MCIFHAYSSIVRAVAGSSLPAQCSLAGHALSIPLPDGASRRSHFARCRRRPGAWSPRHRRCPAQCSLAALVALARGSGPVSAIVSDPLCSRWTAAAATRLASLSLMLQNGRPAGRYAPRRVGAVLYPPFSAISELERNNYQKDRLAIFLAQNFKKNRHVFGEVWRLGGFQAPRSLPEADQSARPWEPA